MKVYILETYMDHEGSRVVGVFSTVELAKVAVCGEIRGWKRSNRPSQQLHTRAVVSEWGDEGGWTITEAEMDRPLER